MSFRDISSGIRYATSQSLCYQNVKKNPSNEHNEQHRFEDV